MAKTYWDTLPAKQIRLAQEQKLITYLRQQVFPMSPFYRELLEQQELKIGNLRGLEVSQAAFHLQGGYRPFFRRSASPFQAGPPATRGSA